ncbi:hypothetical protein FNF31_00593 [Cafeteria roenbergensis]|uniref:Uncharacterized protein n=1 Tax=Cafeteria roenbergensis TaxID=33653 RepID=A0A5A8DDD7_CAFRO|nr:hypothetical protein FNF28_04242 [Cafeteria roenbergensis]KAA0168094.1 hypothetical protein FNF31_00593 [Cafeteria roenbergensis]
MAAAVPVGRIMAKMAVVGFLTGVGLEVFMVATGFYGVATRKEAERRVEAREALKDIRQTQRRRWRDALADSVRDHGGGDDAGAGDSEGASPAGARD